MKDDISRPELDGNLTTRYHILHGNWRKLAFEKGFSGITDLEVGPDGFLYALSYGKGIIYRISPK